VGLENLGKILLWVGLGIIVLGALFLVFAKLGFTRLPGTFVFRGDNVTVYVPMGLMLVVSIAGSLILHFLGRR
jgi:multisubunit Na+/H+ antiporter MnhG subunit